MNAYKNPARPSTSRNLRSRSRLNVTRYLTKSVMMLPQPSAITSAVRRASQLPSWCLMRSATW